MKSLEIAPAGNLQTGLIQMIKIYIPSNQNAKNNKMRIVSGGEDTI
jgi:hypothetical protein